MLCRVGLVTVLLSTVAMAELAAPVDENTSPLMTALFALIAFTYLATLIYALILRRGARRGMGAVQVALDLLTATLLVHLTGGVESVFGFMLIAMYMPIFDIAGAVKAE